MSGGMCVPVELRPRKIPLGQKVWRHFFTVLWVHAIAGVWRHFCDYPEIRLGDIGSVASFWPSPEVWSMKKRGGIFASGLGCRWLVAWRHFYIEPAGILAHAP